MKNYKRLTNNNRDGYDAEYDFCCDCKYFGEPCGCNRPNGTCSNYDRFLETYSRLAELEGKIENGTLVELPCEVGDKIYRATEFIPLFSENCLWTVLDFEIVKIEIYQGEILFYDDSDNEIRLDDFGKTVFLTEEAAEKRLKELQEKQK